MAGARGSSAEPVRQVCVIGIGADGWDGLSPSARARLEAASVVIGAQRHVDLLPAQSQQLRLTLPRPLREGLLALLDEHHDVVVLASGDPLISGIGTTLINLLGAAAVEIVPAVSSVSLARARMRWPAETCAVISVVGRDVSLIRREVTLGRRILVLSSDETTPVLVAAMLVEDGFGASRMTVLSDLDSPAEARIDETAATLNADNSRIDANDSLLNVNNSLLNANVSRLNVVAVEVVGAFTGVGWVAGLPDDAFEHDGQLTKRDLRASALARLAPTPGEHLWDVGAGAGSIGIEWMRAHPTCRTTAVEADPRRADRIAHNAARLGVPGLVVVNGRAPDALADLTPPDAIFIGGGATRSGVLDACLAALRRGGRLVVHGVTLETEQLLAEAYRMHGGELTRISVETTAPVGTFTGWTPARAVTQWALMK